MERTISLWLDGRNVQVWVSDDEFKYRYDGQGDWISGLPERVTKESVLDIAHKFEKQKKG